MKEKIKYDSKIDVLTVGSWGCSGDLLRELAKMFKGIATGKITVEEK
jgi:hypothetical protein